MSNGNQRRLAAIVAADVAGYSRLMGTDEEGTIAALRGHRREVIEPLLARFGGRIANTAGDSLLLEFSSAVDALRCSIEMQDEIDSRNSTIAVERRLLFRVGINVGDVVADGSDLLGDGVNVAARLEALAEPGGICLSRSARDQVRDRLEVRFEDCGELEVKNIARPVRVFRVLPEGTVSAAAGRKFPATWMFLATAVLALFVLAGGYFWLGQQPPEAEMGKQTGVRGQAYDLYINGRAKRIPPTPGNLSAALKLFEKAIAIDPKFAGGYAGASSIHVLLYGDTTIKSEAPGIHLETALLYAQKAVDLEPKFGPAWGSLAEALYRKGRYDEALAAIAKAMKAAPNDALMRAYYGRLLGHAGRPQDGIEQVKRAMRMSPDSLPMLYFLGANQRAAGQFDKAVETLLEHRSRLGGKILPAPTLQLIAAYVQSGQLSKARAETRALLKLAPHYTVQAAGKIHNYRRQSDKAQFSSALAQAGLREN